MKLLKLSFLMYSLSINKIKKVEQNPLKKRTVSHSKCEGGSEKPNE